MLTTLSIENIVPKFFIAVLRYFGKIAKSITHKCLYIFCEFQTSLPWQKWFG
jgi:hypothetical protein